MKKFLSGESLDHDCPGTGKTGYLLRLLFLCLVIIELIACGRYSAPEPPEFFSPMTVQELIVRPQASGVEFTWKAPDADLRGRELRSMDGYRIYRKEFLVKADLIDPRGYEEIGFVEDLHVKIREERREAAIEKGIPSRKVSIEEELQSFRYQDNSAKAGKVYLYKITPVNQGGVEGKTDIMAKVQFRGLNSVVQMQGVRGDEAIDIPVEPLPLDTQELSGQGI